MINVNKHTQSLELENMRLRGELERQAEAHSFWYWTSCVLFFAFLIAASPAAHGGAKCS